MTITNTEIQILYKRINEIYTNIYKLFSESEIPISKTEKTFIFNGLIHDVNACINILGSNIEHEIISNPVDNIIT